MKKLSIEEKANAYDNVRNKIAARFGTNVAQEIFSEYEESEDEKTRKEIVDYLKKNLRLEWATWLEKQGNPNKEYWRGYREGKKEILDKYSEVKKQMTTPEESLGISSEEWNEIVDECVYGEHPKFNIGDWIVSDLEDVNEDFRLCKVIDIKDGCYTIQSANGCKGYNFFETWESDYRLWSIIDAKPGDVLAIELNGYYSHPFVAIFKEQDCEYFNSYCFIGHNGKFYTAQNGHTNEDIHPATKEQRDLLFKKMKEAGYEWDAEKKELKKIDWNDRIKYNPNAPSIIEKNTSWSEEDEMMLECVLDKIGDLGTGVMCKEWLKGLKQRYTWKPTDGQIKALKDACDKSWEPDGLDPLYTLYQDLEKLKGK